MKFTKKQFSEIGPWYFNDLCFDSTNQTTMLKIFNLLPSNLQGLAVSWGCDDSVFRDDVFEFLIKNQFDMTVKEYYDSNIFNWFIKKGHYQKFSFDKLEPKTVQFDIETEGITTVYDGNIKPWDIRPSKKVTGFQEAITEMMSSGNGLAKGELGLIMAPRGVGKYNPQNGKYDEKIQNLIKKHNKDA